MNCEKIEPIIRKVSIIGEDFSVSFEEDETEYALDLIANKSNGLDFSNIYNYFAEGEFTNKQVDELNGEHFLYGFLEALGQSNRCPDILYTSTGPFTYKVEKINKKNSEE